MLFSRIIYSYCLQIFKADESDITHLGKSLREMETLDDISISEDQAEEGIAIMVYLEDVL